MYKVYVLYAKSFDKIYIGYSANLPERIKAHNELATKGWTIRYRPWEVVHVESFDTKQLALKREKELKSYQGRLFIRRMIKNSSDG